MSLGAFGDEGNVCTPCQENGGSCKDHPRVEAPRPTFDELRARVQFKKITAACTEKGGCVCVVVNAATCYRMIGYIQAHAPAAKPTAPGGTHG